LTHLAPNQREALVLRELEGRSYAEIATVLGLSESAVETLIFRARRALREQLEETVGCDEAATLLEADVLSLDERRRLRAHTRACADCASLERRARGRKSALRRIASSIGLPWWGGKAALVALSVGAAATTIGVAVANPHPHTFPVTNIAPAHVDRPLAPVPLAAHRRAAHAARHTAEKHAAVVTHKVSATVKVSDTRSVARGGGHSPAGVVDEAPDSQPAAVEPSAPTTPQTPVKPAAPAPKPAQPVTVTPPTVTVPSVTVTTPVATVTTPTVTTPTVTVTVPQVTPPPLPHLGP
jgi:transposase